MEGIADDLRQIPALIEAVTTRRWEPGEASSNQAKEAAEERLAAATTIVAILRRTGRSVPLELVKPLATVADIIEQYLEDDKSSDEYKEWARWHEMSSSSDDQMRFDGEGGHRVVEELRRRIPRKLWLVSYDLQGLRSLAQSLIAGANTSGPPKVDADVHVDVDVDVDVEER